MNPLIRSARSWTASDAFHKGVLPLGSIAVRVLTPPVVCLVSDGSKVAQHFRCVARLDNDVSTSNGGRDEGAGIAIRLQLSRDAQIKTSAEPLLNSVAPLMGNDDIDCAVTDFVVVVAHPGWIVGDEIAHGAVQRISGSHRSPVALDWSIHAILGRKRAGSGSSGPVA